jgi:hypothetical protein
MAFFDVLSDDGAWARSALGSAMVRTLRDELVLLAFDEQGRWSPELISGLDGAALLELILADHLCVEDNRVVVRDPSPLGDSTLDAVLAKVAKRGKASGLNHWLNWGLSGVNTFRPTVEALVEAGVIEDKRWRLGHRYPERDGGVGREIRDRVRMVLLTGASDDVRAVALIALADGCRLYDRLIAERPAAEVRELARLAVERAILPEGIAPLVQELSAAIGKKVDAGRQSGSNFL